MKWVLITGASSGIGWETAKIFHNNGYGVVAVARREEKLKELQEELKTDIEYIVADLTKNIDTIFNFIEKNSIKIDIVINNAGFGINNKFLDINLETQQNMIDLNVKSLTTICYKFGHYFKDNKINGTIINLASQASFLPGPYMAVYYATKSFVLSLTEALNYEFKENNIHIMAICPGPTKSEFSKVANSGTNFAFSSKKIPTANDVATYIYKSFLKKRIIAIHPPIKGFLSMFVLRLLPRKLIVKISAFTAKKDDF